MPGRLTNLQRSRELVLDDKFVQELAVRFRDVEVTPRSAVLFEKRLHLGVESVLVFCAVTAVEATAAPSESARIARRTSASSCSFQGGVSTSRGDLDSRPVDRMYPLLTASSRVQ